METLTAKSQVSLHFIKLKKSFKRDNHSKRSLLGVVETNQIHASEKAADGPESIKKSPKCHNQADLFTEQRPKSVLHLLNLSA